MKPIIIPADACEAISITSKPNASIGSCCAQTLRTAKGTKSRQLLVFRRLLCSSDESVFRRKVSGCCFVVVCLVLLHLFVLLGGGGRVLFFPPSFLTSQFSPGHKNPRRQCARSSPESLPPTPSKCCRRSPLRHPGLAQPHLMSSVPTRPPNPKSQLKQLKGLRQGSPLKALSAQLSAGAQHSRFRAPRGNGRSSPGPAAPPELCATDTAFCLCPTRFALIAGGYFLKTCSVSFNLFPMSSLSGVIPEVCAEEAQTNPQKVINNFSPQR